MENLANTTTDIATPKMTEDEINSHKIGSGKHNGMNSHYYDSEEAAIAKRESLKSMWKKGFGTIYGPFTNTAGVTYWEVTGFREGPSNDFVRDVVGSGRSYGTSASRSKN